jgi:hypothetical protein
VKYNRTEAAIRQIEKSPAETPTADYLRLKNQCFKDF